MHPVVMQVVMHECSDGVYMVMMHTVVQIVVMHTVIL